jgi:hypothetical protein
MDEKTVEVNRRSVGKRRDVCCMVNVELGGLRFKLEYNYSSLRNVKS